MHRPYRMEAGRAKPAANSNEAENRPRILPPALLFMAILAIAGLHLWLPGATVIPAPYNLLGGIVLVLGVALILWSGWLFVHAGTTTLPHKKPDRLVTGGPYRITRHPMYLGMALILAGLAILLGTLTPWLVLPIFMGLVTRQFMGPEERRLRALFGADYDAYCRQVRRWL